MQGRAYAIKFIRVRLSGKKEPPQFHCFNKDEMAVTGRAAAVANILDPRLRTARLADVALTST
jgi:hypothetical protein